jgi:hypothetical protein
MARFFDDRLPDTMAWIKQRTAEYRITNYEGLNRFAKSFFNSQDTIIRRSMLISFFFDQAGRFYWQLG